MPARIIRVLDIYGRLQLLHLRVHLEYEADFWISIVGVILTQGCGLAFIWLVFQRVPEIAGWGLWEVAVLYALLTIPRGLVEILCDGPWYLRRLVNQGELDRILVRPISPALQVITQISSIHGFGSVLLGGAILVRAMGELEPWRLWQYGLLMMTLASSVVLMGSINYLVNCIGFWEPAASGSFPFLAYSVADLARYPITLYGRFVRLLATWVLPFAFVSYYPGVVLLRKPVGDAWLGLLSPAAAAGAAAVTALVWRAGLGRYQGVGH